MARVAVADARWLTIRRLASKMGFNSSPPCDKSERSSAHGLQAEFVPMTRRRDLAVACANVGVLDAGFEPSQPLADVIGAAEKAGLAVDDSFADPVDIRDDRRKPRCHRLENRERESFVERGQNKNVEAGHGRPHIVLPPREQNAIGDVVVRDAFLEGLHERAAADPDESHVRGQLFQE